jgi:glycosyltransferase involved in cell wall biosynthesis
VKACKKPVVVTLHTVLQAPSPNQKRIIQEFARDAASLIVMVGVGKRILNEVYGVSPEKIRVIPHGVPNVKMVGSAAAKNSLGYGGKYILSTFGLLSRGKGIEDAIKAMPAIVERIPNAVYLVLGETHPAVRKHEGESYRNYLIELVQSLDMGDHVSFNNRYLSLGQLIRYLSATDVYITPYLSKDQITSGTLAYALGCGKAIVSTPYLYAEETLSEGRGCLVDFKSPETIAQCVQKILSDKPFRESLETEAYAYGRRTTWFNVAVEYLDLFYSVCRSC